jgi:L-serine/L-threonine ammonia-lyase
VIHVRTPLVESEALGRILGRRVLLKLEALQPGGSFKIRGIGLRCERLRAAGVRRFVSSSGGNAGLAVAHAGRRLGVPVTVFVPESTPPMMRDRIRAEGAEVEVRGRGWDEAHQAALQIAEQTGAGYLHPFEGTDVWEGHATMIDEVADEGARPGAVVLSVGGGGLLCGVAMGMHRHGWTDIPIVAAETEGAASLAAAMSAGRLVTLDRITSLATTLGARTVSPEALAWTRRHPVSAWTVSDRQAVDACWRFAQDHRLLVEPACGAALSAVYERAEPLAAADPVLVIVCGGAGVTPELLAGWRAAVGAT